jgi:hypothetical protein
MAAEDPDYDRLYFLLDLQPGDPVDQVKQNFRQLAQIFHSDKWQYPSPASTKWAEERFKAIKQAKDILERHWDLHGCAPPSSMAIDPDVLQRHHTELAQLRQQKAALESETGSVRAEYANVKQAVSAMDLERGRLRLELSSLNAQLEQVRSHAAGVHAQLEAEMAQPFAHASAEPGLAYQWVFTHLDDPETGRLWRAGIVFGVIFAALAVANGVSDALFGIFDLGDAWDWLRRLIDVAGMAAGSVVVLGWAWAQWTLYKANQAGLRRAINLPVLQSWSGVATALHYEGHHGSRWEFVPGADEGGLMSVEMRALLRFSTKAHPFTRRLREQVVTLFCRAGSAEAQQTSLTYRFELTDAPHWWLVPAARIVHAASERLQGHMKTQTP